MGTPTDRPETEQTMLIRGEPELQKWATEFIKRIQPPRVILLEGPMGSGKTTLVRGLMVALKGTNATSPTFSLVNEYHYPGGQVYHFDLYRLESPDELEEIGFEEYLGKEALTFIEWPDLGIPFYDDALTETIRMEILPDGNRRIDWYKGIVL